MSAVLIMKDWDDCDMYGVLEFANPIARFNATEIIREVKENNPDGWDIEDIWNALCNSGIDFKAFDDIQEYYI